jgi:hypothetical protein
MLSVHEVIERLKTAPNRQAVADATGLKYMYLSRLAWGEIKEPGATKLDKLREYFKGQK